RPSRTTARVTTTGPWTTMSAALLLSPWPPPSRPPRTPGATMLKLIRKFQLVILAVGGSLLMVVFLLEPVLTSFQKSQANRTVARLADGSKVSLMEFERARVELELARRVAPAVFLPKQQQGLGLTADA